MHDFSLDYLLSLDETLLISHEELETLKTGFQKCVICPSYLLIVAIMFFTLTHMIEN